MSYLKREELLGKTVISGNAEVIGTVKEIVVSTDGKVGLHVEPKASSGTNTEETIVNADEIQAMADVILLKTTGSNHSKVAEPPVLSPPPMPTLTSGPRSCNHCGYTNSANSRFCIKCGKSLQNG
ncbi:MAG: PRC-barrel domain-containing protein [Nitrososphaerota archaeon]|nr:PRC-barrel domain-containing protein [Nitrososphaerota archaeon]